MTQASRQREGRSVGAQTVGCLTTVLGLGAGTALFQAGYGLLVVLIVLIFGAYWLVWRAVVRWGAPALAAVAAFHLILRAGSAAVDGWGPGVSAAAIVWPAAFPLVLVLFQWRQTTLAERSGKQWPRTWLLALLAYQLVLSVGTALYATGAVEPRDFGPAGPLAFLSMLEARARLRPRAVDGAEGPDLS